MVYVLTINYCSPSDADTEINMFKSKTEDYWALVGSYYRLKAGSGYS